jgi:hypothetical protein
MKKLIILSLLISAITVNIYAERYEPLMGKSGSVIDFGGVRFPMAWGYSEYTGNYDASLFNFGLDFGIGLSTELQNRIDYNSTGDQWENWTELLKIRLSDTHNGPAIGLGLGARIPLHHPKDNFGLIAGLYISSAIKDIDFDFNIGVNPSITYRQIASLKLGNTETTISEKNHYVNFNLLFGKKLLDFLKVGAGFEMKQYFSGQRKTEITVNDNSTETFASMGQGSSWTFLFGVRLKPQGYPVLLDNSLAFGTGNMNNLDFTYRIGVQILPQSPNAEW